MDYDSLKERVADALSPVCDSLGLGPTADLLTCRVTDEVVAATVNEGLQKSLRYWLTQGDLSVYQVGALQCQLEQDFPDEAAAVIATVKTTGSLGHQSAISLDIQEEKVWVSLVNGDGDHLKLEAYKFLGMLEHPTTGRLLHRFEGKKWQSSADPFVLKDYREGEVSGCFFPEQCRVEVAHVLEKGKRTNDRCQFYLEREYLACLFVVLARLREDREHINRLLENAEATLTFDPFEVIKGSHH